MSKVINRISFGFCSFVLVLFVSTAAHTGPIIKANGATGNVIINYPAPVTITVEMNAGQYAGVPVDWWVLALVRGQPPDWYYLNSAWEWIFFGNEDNLALSQPVYQGPLTNLSSTPVLSGVTLPPQTYFFWFAVDDPMDGILNQAGQILYDRVTVVVQ